MIIQQNVIQCSSVAYCCFHWATMIYGTEEEYVSGFDTADQILHVGFIHQLFYLLNAGTL